MIIFINPVFFSRILKIIKPITDTTINSEIINWTSIIINAVDESNSQYVPIAGININNTGNNDAINKFFCLIIKENAKNEAKVPKITSNTAISDAKLAKKHPNKSPGINLLL